MKDRKKKKPWPVLMCAMVTFAGLVSPLGIVSAQSFQVKYTFDAGTLQNSTGIARHDTLDTLTDTTAVGNDTIAARKDTLDIITSEEAFNTVPGFRIQLMTTQNLSDAIAARARADTLLSDYNIYIIYDSPYYKIRAGDFRAKYDASQAADYIASHGFPDAWPVPDNVFRTPRKKGGQ